MACDAARTQEALRSPRWEVADVASHVVSPGHESTTGNDARPDSCANCDEQRVRRAARCAG